MDAICEINDHAEGLIFYLLNEVSQNTLGRQQTSFKCFISGINEHSQLRNLFI